MQAQTLTLVFGCVASESVKNLTSVFRCMASESAKNLSSIFGCMDTESMKKSARVSIGHPNLSKQSLDLQKRIFIS